MTEYETYIKSHTPKELFYVAFDRYMQGWDADDFSADICASDASILLSETTHRPDEKDMTPYIKRFLAECE